MSTYNIPPGVLDSLKTEEGEQLTDTSKTDPDKKVTTDDTKTKPTEDGGKPEDGDGEGNEPSKGDSEGDIEPTKLKEPTSVKLDGKEYGLEDLDRIVKEHQENKDWKKSNTEKAQALSAQSKAIEGADGFLEKLLQDEDALEVLEDMGHKLDKKALSAGRKAAKEAQTDLDKVEPETDEAMVQIQADLNELKFNAALRDFIVQDEEHQKALGKPEQLGEFLKFMVDNNLPDLDKAYEFYSLKAKLKEAEEAVEKGSGSKTGTKKAPLGKGAKDIVTDFKPETGDFGYEKARKAALKLFGKK